MGTYTTAGVELDFKTKKYVSANPYLFRYWMCPQCNYSARAGSFGEALAPELAEATRRALGEPTNYDDCFAIPMSAILRRARQCLTAANATQERLAWFELFGAWMARDAGEKKAEREFHLRARAAFEIVAVEGEGNDRAVATYLVGEIHRRYGRLGTARHWLDRAEKVAVEVASKNVPDWVKSCRKQLELDEAGAIAEAGGSPLPRPAEEGDDEDGELRGDRTRNRPPPPAARAAGASSGGLSSARGRRS